LARERDGGSAPKTSAEVFPGAEVLLQEAGEGKRPKGQRGHSYHSSQERDAGKQFSGCGSWRVVIDWMVFGSRT